MNRLALTTTVAMLALFSSRTALAGKECKGVKITDDQFGGGKQALGVIQKQHQFASIGLRIEKKSDQAAFVLAVREGGAVKAVVEAGLTIPVRLESGEVLELTTISDSSGQSYVSGSAVMSNMTYSLPLTDEQLKKLASSPIAAIRIPIVSQGTTHDWEASKKVKKGSAAIASCIANL